MSRLDQVLIDYVGKPSPFPSIFLVFPVEIVHPPFLSHTMAEGVPDAALDGVDPPMQR